MRTADIMWNAAPGERPPVAGEVQVFCAPLDVAPRRLEQLTQSLSDEEWQRAGRFHIECHRERFLAGRGTLREILGERLNIAPASLVFAHGKYGKPEIAAPVAAHALHFNVAHSDAFAVYAIAQHELGVDLERVRVLKEAGQIAARFFSPREVRCLRALPAEQRTEAFFNCWTRKEAYLKAIGSGLDDSLDQIEVSLAPGEAAELLGGPKDSRRWRLHSLVPSTEFVGALAIPPEVSHVNCWQWNGLP